MIRLGLALATALGAALVATAVFGQGQGPDGRAGARGPEAAPLAAAAPTAETPGENLTGIVVRLEVLERRLQELAGELAALDADLAGDLGRRLAAIEAGIDALLTVVARPPLPPPPGEADRRDALAEAVAALSVRIAAIEAAIGDLPPPPTDLAPLLAELQLLRETQIELAVGFAELADVLAAQPAETATNVDARLAAIEDRLALLEGNTTPANGEPPPAVELPALAEDVAGLRIDVAAIAERQTELERMFAELLAAQEEMLDELRSLTAARAPDPAVEAPPAAEPASTETPPAAFGEELRLRLNALVTDLRRGLAAGG